MLTNILKNQHPSRYKLCQSLWEIGNFNVTNSSA